MTKYHNRKTVLDGMTFDSAAIREQLAQVTGKLTEKTRATA